MPKRKTSASPSRALARSDGWANILSGAGTAKDPRTASRFIGNMTLDAQTLDELEAWLRAQRERLDDGP